MKQLVCQDDFGTGMYACKYATEPVPADNVLVVGAIIPGCKGKTLIPNTPEGRAKHKQSIKWFHENEQNCNTCKNLVRTPHEKRSDGFLEGMCGGSPISFHPDDWMGKECYVPRWAEDDVIA